MPADNKTPATEDRVVDDGVIIAMTEKLLHPPYWMRDAECVLQHATLDDLQNDNEVFIRRFCNHCTVKQQCLQWGEKHASHHTVFGGKILEDE